MTHYTKEELALFQQDKMSPLKKIACSLHLKHCRECTARLNELQQEEIFLEELKNSLRILDQLDASSPAAHK